MSHVQPLSTDVRVKVKALPQYKVLSSLQRRVKKSTRKVADKRKKKKAGEKNNGKIMQRKKSQKEIRGVSSQDSARERWSKPYVTAFVQHSQAF